MPGGEGPGSIACANLSAQYDARAGSMIDRQCALHAGGPYLGLILLCYNECSMDQMIAGEPPASGHPAKASVV